MRAEIANAVSEHGIEAVSRAIGMPRGVVAAYVAGDCTHERLIEHRAVPTWPEARPGARLSIADLPQLGEIGLRHVVTAKRALARWAGARVALESAGVSR